jgi:hypothetical protein
MEADGVMSRGTIRMVQDVPVEFQRAFQSAWRETKYIPLGIRNHSVLCAALRVMFPPYTGPAVQLFWGARFNEARGMPWEIALRPKLFWMSSIIRVTRWRSRLRQSASRVESFYNNLTADEFLRPLVHSGASTVIRRATCCDRPGVPF